MSCYQSSICCPVVPGRQGVPGATGATGPVVKAYLVLDVDYTEPTIPIGESVKWKSVREDDPDNYLELGSDTTEIKILKPGYYYVQFNVMAKTALLVINTSLTLMNVNGNIVLTAGLSPRATQGAQEYSSGVYFQVSSASTAVPFIVKLTNFNGDALQLSPTPYTEGNLSAGFLSINLESPYP